MTVVLFAAPKLPLSSIADNLRAGGVEVEPFVLTSSLRVVDIPRPVAQGVLIANETGVVNVGEQAEQVRELIGHDSSLLLCIPQTTPADRQILQECGASEIVIPQSWQAQHVAERLLGQMIRGGLVQPSRYGEMYGGTAHMRELYDDIARIAPLSDPVLILGETGTGKELVAHELHERSGRPKTYLPINCPEIQLDLLSSELFGHAKGAFTGAEKSRKGLIAAAGDGTVFLDEIGELDMQSQAKLLRVLEKRQVRKVGSNDYEEVNARVILATNRDLSEACANGKFRHDLFERIRGFRLELPSLRQRKADIPILVDHFIEEYNREYKADYKLAAGALDHLFHHDWPGNIRELRGVVRKAAAYSDAGFVSSLVLQESVQTKKPITDKNVLPFDPETDKWRDLVNRAQSAYFRALLAHTNGNKEIAIKLSGLSRSQFFQKVKEIAEDQ